jgi:D-alanyl-D-alanine carboxypeptidase/D-alanyl-D-alanine-endopeptidase (penicillin-binding protein 4)
VAAGREAVAAFLKRHAPGEDNSLQDGSGLSRTDLITPHDLVSLLAAMHRHPHGQDFRDSLAVAGVDGTLDRRMRGGAPQGRVFAKTGTLKQTNALAGYVKTRSGSWLAFSIFINHHTAPGGQATRALDSFAAILAGR